MDERFPFALPVGTILCGQYIIEKVLGQGGFGITYMASDHLTGQKVAIKEFFPDTLAARTNSTNVAAFTGERGENFAYGKQCFLQEAKTLAEFIGNENIVRIYSYFEENGTAYFVMEFIEGISFDKYIKNNGGKISYPEAEKIILKVMDALSAVHQKGIIHRDVTPDNIYITNDGVVKLLDFGAARYSLGDRSRSLDVILKHGFAPKEQYTRHGRQGAFTDVYALGATFYFAITGKKLPDSIDRMDIDDLIPPNVLGVSISKEKEEVILKAMAVQPFDRFQTMDEFKAALMGEIKIDYASQNRLGDNIQVAQGQPSNVIRFSSEPVQVMQDGDPIAPGLQTPFVEPPMQGQQSPYVTPPMQGQAGQYITPPMQGQAGQYITPPMQGQADQHVAPPMQGQQSPYVAPPVQGKYAQMQPVSKNAKKKKKGIIIGGIIAAVLLIFVAIGFMAENNARDYESKKDSSSSLSSSSKRDESDDKNDSGLIKVGIINNDPNESGYRTANDADLKATFTKENGYDAQFAYSLKNDEQIAAAKKFIQDGVDYLLLSAADTTGWDSVLQDAQKEGVKVILFDRTIDADPSLYEASIVSDMAKEGQTAIDWLAGQNLDTYNVIHIQGVMGSAAQQGRSAALDTMVANNDSWNIVVQQTAEWNAEKAQQIVQAQISAGAEFNVIYAENDDMAKGAVAALDAAGISHGIGGDVIIIGFDCDKWALRELLDGTWNLDVQCSPFHAAYIDDVIRKLEAGKTIKDKTIIVDDKGFDAKTITADDVEKYGI